MRKLALGVVAAGALLAAAPAAMAQVGFYAGPGGVGIGAPGPYYDRCGYPGYPCRDYYDYSGPDVVVGGGWAGHPHFHGHFHHH